MNIFILGNGFDLHHSLPTSYMNFLNTVKFLVDNYEKDTMKSVGNVFSSKKLQETDSSISESYSLYNKIYDDIPLNESQASIMIMMAKTNIWFKYFTQCVNKNFGWIDLEKEIAFVIDTFRLAFEKISPKFGLKHIMPEQNRMVVLKHFNFFYNAGPANHYVGNPMEEAKTVKEKYCFENHIGSNVIEVNKAAIVNDLYKSLQKCADILKLYLTIFVESLVIKMNDAQILPKKSIYENGGRVITFNYTKTFEYLYATSDNVNHIHGSLDNNIVLGVNPDDFDELGYLDTLFIQFKKYYQRVFFKSDIPHLQMIKNIDLYKKYGGISLYIIGHSLDITDEDIIKEWILNAKEIKIFYHEENAIGTYIKNLVSMFGKKDFDELRVNNSLQFLPIPTLEWERSPTNAKP